MEFVSIQAGVLSLISQLERAGLGQIEGLSQLVSVAMVDQVLDLQGLRQLVQNANTDRIRSLVDFANRRFGPGSDGNASMVPKSAEYQFGVLYNIYLLKEMFTSLTTGQMTKLLDLVPPVQSPTQLQHLQDLQQLLLQLEAGQFLQIKADIEHISRENPGEEVSALTQLVDLGTTHFHLYETLRQMLNFSEEDFLVIQSTYPGWSHLHLGLLSKIRTLSPYEFRDLAKLLSGPARAKSEDDEDAMDVEERSTGSVTSGARTQGALALQITDQPPDKCVYKRNVKPPPSVTVEGDMTLFDGSVYVVPILSRCDTAEDLPTMMAGSSPVKLTNTRTLTFGKLKILATTHQMNETMFALRFELRRYERAGQSFKLLDSVTTDPFTVVSHSTQLKPSFKNLPTVSEVIPYGGPTTGSTRVAILGVNFQDSPTTRVRFDNIEVIPIFHGSKTLLCHTPRHEPGLVQVTVCNEPNAWSVVRFSINFVPISILSCLKTAGSFTYDEPNTPLGSSGHMKVSHSFQAPHSPQQEHTFVGSTNLFESFGAPKLSNSQAIEFDLGSSQFIPNKLDARGYAPIHTIAAYGDVNALRVLATKTGVNPFIADKSGNSALHWSVRNGHFEVTRMLVQSARPLLDQRNSDGESPLHWAVRRGDDVASLKIALLLIQAGASVNAQDAQGLTPLHLSVADGHGKMVQLLLQCNADATVPELGEGLTPVHFAAIYNRPAILQPLSQVGFSLNVRDDEGDTPLHWAYRFNNEEMALVLIALGALSTLVNTAAELPADLARVEPSSQVVIPTSYLSLSEPQPLLAFPSLSPQCTPVSAFGQSFTPFGVFVQ